MYFKTFKEFFEKNGKEAFTGTVVREYADKRAAEKGIRQPKLIGAFFMALASCLADGAELSYPLWDGTESVACYAPRTGLEQTKIADLGNGITIELVLIPAGKFIMGTPKPESEWIGGSIMAIGILLFTVMLGYVVVINNRRRRFQYSLRWLIGIVFIVGVVQYGGLRWWEARRANYGWAFRESPAHEVIIVRPFYMGKYETTQEQYQQIMGLNPSEYKRPKNPVEVVDWDDTQEFCRKASEKTGFIVRLPTEAEWEYACRAGTTTRYFSGDADGGLKAMAWYRYNSGANTQPVGQKQPNAWGLYDMHGNALEWCQDWFGHYSKGPATNPKGANSGSYKVLRGGSFGSLPWQCRSSARYFYGGKKCESSPAYSGEISPLWDFGFRVVVDIK